MKVEHVAHESFLEDVRPYGYAVRKDDGTLFGVVYGDKLTEAKANAELVSSAPAMLAQLEECAGNFKVLAIYLTQLRDAGVSFPSVANTPSIDLTIDALRIREAQVRVCIAAAEGRS